jgi:hypothetical protein
VSKSPKKIINKSGEIVLPYGQPFWIGCIILPSIEKLLVKRNICTILNVRCDTPILLSLSNRMSWSTLSKADLQSTKSKYCFVSFVLFVAVSWAETHFSKSFSIQGVVPFPFLNPNCSIPDTSSLLAKFESSVFARLSKYTLIMSAI